MRASRRVVWIVGTTLVLAAYTARASAQTRNPSFTTAPEQSPAPKANPDLEPTTGSFVRAIPLEVPAFHGIEPSLALSYSSQGGNGLCGVGWQLGGYGMVERTRTGRGTPRFEATDVFVLNGQELLPCAAVSHSPGCAAGGTHATKQESYTRIRFDAASNSWTVWAKSGIRTVFQAVHQVSGGTWRWGQSQVIDTHDNTVTYTWHCDGYDCYPSGASYGPYAVSLFWEPRPDALTFATGGLSGIGTTGVRLRSILVARGTTPIRAYRLGYQASMATGRSLLQEVQQYGFDVQIDAQGAISGGTTLPPQTFRYQEAQ